MTHCNKIKFSSLHAQVVVVLLCATLLPGFIVTWLSLHLMATHIKEDRIQDVGVIVDSKRDQLVSSLKMQNQRAKIFLENLNGKCAGQNNPSNVFCKTTLLESYLASEGAIGATLHGYEIGTLSIGTHTTRMPEDSMLQAGQLAKFYGTGPGNNRSYFISVADDKMEYRLVVTYPSTKLQSIFFPYPADLGQSGETFLADGEGSSVTPLKYAPTQSQPLVSPPMQACLRGQSGSVLDLDYRNVDVIHGFRFIPELGSACIMAHISQEEAFSPLKLLEWRLMYALTLFSILMILVSVFLAKRIVHPIAELTKVTRDMASGNMLLKADEMANDELIELATSFNTTTRMLRESRQLLDSIVEHIPVMVFVKRADDLRIELFNQAGQQLTGYSSDELLGKGNYDLWPKKEGDFFTAADRQALESHEITHIPEEQITRANGDILYLQTWKVALRDATGKPTHLLGISIDITERKRAEEELRVAAATFETSEAIMITDAQAHILRVNRAFQEITGYSQEEIVGKNPRILSSGRHDSKFFEAMWNQLIARGSWSGEVWDKRKNGEIYPKWQTISCVKNKAGEVTEYVAIFSDISSRIKAEKEIYNLAFYDSLTNLPNRRLFSDHLHTALALSLREDQYGAILFIDMDNFKMLNDMLGHDYGDLLLIEVAKRIRANVREIDSVARFGGDEFVVLIGGIGKIKEQAIQQAASIAEKIRTALAEPYRLKEYVHHSSPSIGVSLYQGYTESADDLLKHADLAMYQVKDSGRNAVRFFDPAMQHAVEVRAVLEDNLRDAITRQQLCLYYQVQIDSEFRPIGAEALIRWTHPVRGMISPTQFIPIAEESSLILDIGYWVLDTACSQLKIWAQHELTQHLTLAVNVSAKQFTQVNFVKQVNGLLLKHQIKPEKLKLELTESVVLGEVKNIVATMHAIKMLGVKLSMDDFGTGYSSLSYLKQLPLDQIKIDQSFVRDITTDPSDAVMVQTIIALAKNFRLNVIAEGVETKEQLEFLKFNGCMAYQGYLFSKPVPIEQFEELLNRTDDVWY